MATAPTLQSLARYAYDHFGDERSSFDDSIASSLDTVVEAYATEPDGVHGRAGGLLCQRLEHRGHAVDHTEVDEFVQVAVTYLQAVYPDGDGVQADREQRLLSQLFSAHLAEAHVSAGDR